jgi:predicted N-acyltransferase
VLAFTTSASGSDLEDAVVFCEVNSWLTGRRLVSLPFSDHCEPLAAPETAAAIVKHAIDQELDQNDLRYIEIRALQPIAFATRMKNTMVPYKFHELDLRPDLDTLYDNLHHDSIQRKIRRAEREGLTLQEGATEEILDDFYSLLKLTRERHRVPPQPKKWFLNLIECFGDALTIRVAYSRQRAVAAMLTLRHGDTLVYKYGCSDRKFNNLGGMHLLYWQAIQEAKAAGLSRFDFGRTDADQQGLITFKKRWGAVESSLTYSRYSKSEISTHFFDLPLGNWKARMAQSLMSRLPFPFVAKIGELLYRHVG